MNHTPDGTTDPRIIHELLHALEHIEAATRLDASITRPDDFAVCEAAAHLRTIVESCFDDSTTRAKYEEFYGPAPEP